MLVFQAAASVSAEGAASTRTSTRAFAAMVPAVAAKEALGTLHDRRTVEINKGMGKLGVSLAGIK